MTDNNRTDSIPSLRQNLLYLIGTSTSLNSSVVGMSIFENGELSDGPADTSKWPYRSVADALNDGWRIIQFPIIVLPPMELGLRYVPCEFILEKIVALPS